MKQEKYEEVVRDLILVKGKRVEVWAKNGTTWTREKKVRTYKKDAVGRGQNSSHNEHFSRLRPVT